MVGKTSNQKRTTTYDKGRAPEWAQGLQELSRLSLQGRGSWQGLSEEAVGEHPEPVMSEGRGGW